MHCEICGENDVDVFVVLPIGQPNGTLDTIACLECAQESGAYCKRHQVVCLGFEDGTSACTLCIEEIVDSKKDMGEKILRILRENLPEDELQRIEKWANYSGFLVSQSKERCILRAIAAKAERTDESFNRVLREVVEQESTEIIFS